MIQMELKGIQKYYGATKILEDVSFDIKEEEKAAIVGGNGTGKTTIFKIISGNEKKDNGEIYIRKGIEVGYLDQIPDYPLEYKVIDVLNSAFDEVYRVKDEIKQLEGKMCEQEGGGLEKTLKIYSKLQEKFECLDGYRIDEKLSRICIGFKIYDEFKERLFSNLSGGEKTTIILAKILLQEPDILLLDEPSNHLDMESIEWLEDFLKDYKGTVLVISHDRYFMDRVVTKVIELEDMKTDTYIGNYSSYVKQKEEKQLQQMEEYNNQQKKLKEMEKTIKDLRDWGNRGDNEKFFKRAASMQKRLDKIDKLDKPKIEKDKMKANFSNNERSGNEVIIVENLEKSFGDLKLIHKANLKLMYGEKAALVGKNGSGKSTLFKILLEECKADGGIAELGSGIRLGYLPQNIVFNNEELSIIDCFREDISIIEGKAREFLAKFLFYGNSVFKKVKNLSGGEKSRLKLCKLMYNDMNLLLLDEPTNHLDIESREALEDSLKMFHGTIFFISHDRYFINRIAEKVIELSDKKLITYLGNYEYYKEKHAEKVVKEKNDVTWSNKDEKQEKHSFQQFERCEEKSSNNISYEERKQKVKEERKLSNRKKRLEDEINNYEGCIKDVEQMMIQFGDDHLKLKELYDEKEKYEKKLDEVMEEWISL